LGSITIAVQDNNEYSINKGEGAFSRDKEEKGQNISVGNAETESNGHMSKGEQETLIEL
jgi:hypothetical protein